jgi:transcriptional regulator with XRE-family HTH domain
MSAVNDGVTTMTFAEALTSFMAERGMSGRGLARRIPCDNSAVCRYKSGKLRPSLGTAARIDDLLGAGGELKALAKAEAAPARRSVLAGGLLAGGLLAAGPETLELLAWAERHPPKIDAAVVDALAEVLASERRAEDALGAAATLRPVLAQLASVENLVKQARGPLRVALLYVAEQWAQFSGHLCRHAGDAAGARACCAQALEWATELGDKSMVSTLLVSRGYMAAEAGEIGAMIGLAQGAQRDTSAATGQRADAAGFEARGHAMTGDSATAERKLAEARDLAAALADRPDDRRPWAYWLNPAVFANEEGITCAHLAAIGPRWHERAVELLTVKPDESSLWAPAKTLTWLALAHANAGAVDQACATAVTALRAVKRAGSVPHTATLRQISTDLSARYPGDPRVAELAGALA